MTDELRCQITGRISGGEPWCSCGPCRTHRERAADVRTNEAGLDERLRAVRVELYDPRAGGEGSDYRSVCPPACIEAADLIARLTAPDGEMETTAEERAELRLALLDWFSGHTLDTTKLLALLRDHDRLQAKCNAAEASKIELAEHLDKVITLAAVEVKRSNDATTRAEALKAALQEADEWLKAALNMIDGDGMPPNWDGIRAFRKQITALSPGAAP